MRPLTLISLLFLMNLPAQALTTNAVKLIASDGATDIAFGAAVAVSDNTIAVGAPNAEVVGGDAGAAYVFVRDGDAWNPQAKLTAADSMSLDFFGVGVACQSNTVVVGAVGDGVADSIFEALGYVFVRNGTNWSQQAKLETDDGAVEGDALSVTVTLDEDTIVLARSGDAVANVGVAVVFTRTGNNWSQEAKLIPEDVNAIDLYGHAVALSGDTVVVGAPGVLPKGAAYVFVRNGATWSQQAKLVGSEIAAAFGTAVGISGDTIVVGAPGADPGGISAAGAAYVFVRSGTSWSQQAQLVPNAPAINGRFGTAVSIHGDTIAVGIQGSNSADVFTRAGTTWTRRESLGVTPPLAQGRFGWAVANDSRTTVVGDIGRSAAYVYGSPPIQLVALEVVQAIQDWRNSVPLSTFKRTFVRAHFETTDNSRPLVAGVLHGTRDGAPLPGSPLQPLNIGGEITVTTNAAEVRHTLSQSLNFQLPQSWRHGTVQLEFAATNTTDGPVSVVCNEFAETNGVAGDCRVQVTFTDVPALLVKLLQVRQQADSGDIIQEPSTADLVELTKRVAAAFPTPVVSFDAAPLTLSTNIACNTTKVLAMVRYYRQLDGCDTAAGCNRIYYGVLTGCPGRGGLANYPPVMAACGTHNDTQDTAWNIATHELGHALGRPHAVDTSLPLVDGRAQGYCGERASSDTPSFPFFSSFDGMTRPTLGVMPAAEEDLIWGFDTHLNQVIDPSQHSELMGYCGPSYQWPSIYTYTNLLAEITDFFADSQQAPLQVMAATVTSDLLIVRGFINIAADTVEFLPFGKLSGSGAPTAPPPGDYALQLLDAGDVVLDELSFSLDPVSEFDNDLAAFLLLVPADPAIRKAVIRHNGAVIGTRAASSNAPTIQVLAPNGGENVTADPVIVSWQAADLDGDPLAFTVQYSADGGATFETLAVDWTQTTFPLEHEFFAASSNAVVRVIASDGFLTASDDSDAPFHVSNNPPVVFVNAPTEGEMFFGNAPVFFEAFALDKEDGSLGGASLQWTSSLDGALGDDTELPLNANGLSEGEHLITVIATDSAAASSTATVHVVIARDLPAAVADLAIAKNAATDPVGVGNNLTYTLTVTNLGPASASGVTVTDTLPDAVNFVSASAGCTNNGGVVVCGLSNLAHESSATVTIVVTPTGAGSITNHATVSSAAADPVQVNNAAAVVTTVAENGGDDLTILYEGPAFTCSNTTKGTVCTAAGTLTFANSGTEYGAATLTLTTTKQEKPGKPPKWKLAGLLGLSAFNLNSNPASLVQVFLSDDDTLDGADTALLKKPASTATLDALAGTGKPLKLKFAAPKGVDLSGKRLIIEVDAVNPKTGARAVTESNENNNTATLGTIP